MLAWATWILPSVLVLWTTSHPSADSDNMLRTFASQPCPRVQEHFLSWCIVIKTDILMRIPAVFIKINAMNYFMKYHHKEKH